MRTPVTVGVVGGSASVAALVGALEHLPQAELRWLCSDERGVGTRRSVRHTARFVDLLADDRLDAVFVAARAVTAHELTAAALEADKHVYVAGLPAQKPTQVRELLRSARRRGRCLFTGDLHRFEPAVVKLRELVRAPDFGDVLYVESERRLKEEDDVLWDVASEDLALVLHVLGDEPVVVTGSGESYLNPSTPELVEIRLEFATGIVARLMLSALDARAGSRCTVVGAHATAVLERPAAQALSVYAKDGTDAPAVVCPRLATGDAIAKSCEAFLAAVRSLDDVAPRRDLAGIVEVLEQVERSVRRSPTVGVSPDLRVVADTRPA
jgi:predicted dehydrogenase